MNCNMSNTINWVAALRTKTPLDLGESLFLLYSDDFCFERGIDLTFWFLIMVMRLCKILLSWFDSSILIGYKFWWKFWLSIIFGLVRIILTFNERKEAFICILGIYIVNIVMPHKGLSNWRAIPTNWNGCFNFIFAWLNPSK